MTPLEYELKYALGMKRLAKAEGRVARLPEPPSYKETPHFATQRAQIAALMGRMTYQEIANRVGCSRGSVASTVRKLRMAGAA